MNCAVALQLGQIAAWVRSRRVRLSVRFKGGWHTGHFEVVARVKELSFRETDLDLSVALNRMVDRVNAEIGMVLGRRSTSWRRPRAPLVPRRRQGELGREAVPPACSSERRLRLERHVLRRRTGNAAALLVC